MSDLLFILFCVPFTAADYALTSVWPFGSLWCSSVQYLIIVTVFVSIYTLVLMSLDRQAHLQKGIIMEHLSTNQSPVSLAVAQSETKNRLLLSHISIPYPVSQHSSYNYIYLEYLYIYLEVLMARYQHNIEYNWLIFSLFLKKLN